MDNITKSKAAQRADLQRRAPLPPLGALTQWHRELRAHLAGQDAERHSTWRFDHLWRAACYEALARDAVRDGVDPTRHLERAEQCILDAASEVGAVA
jgi:hypothetical protein